jgi:hypothetical protein
LKLKQRIILLAFGLFALATGIFGYTGLWGRMTTPPEAPLRSECCDVIEKAQLWYIRPGQYGGSEGTFAYVDAFVLGYSTIPGKTEWQGKTGTFKIENRTRETFDLVAKDAEGHEIEYRFIQYDTRPDK